MASDLPFRVTQLKFPETNAIQDMIRIYQEAYQNDEFIQLNPKCIMSTFMDQMAKTIAERVLQPECEYFIAREWNSDRIVGWLALAFQLPNGKRISEEHVLLLQYALLPDIVVKVKDYGIGTDDTKRLANAMVKEFKQAREKHLPDGHSILSTLVVVPSFQNKGVATALLSRVIQFTEILSFPIWAQAPEACQKFFERHSFGEVGEYRLDLNEYVPFAIGRSNAKAKEVVPLGKHIIKFMVREEPLESTIGAYRSSKVFEEKEEAARAGPLEEERLKREEKRARENSILGRISKAFFGAETEPATTELLVGEEGQSSSGETAVASSLAEADASTPLLAESKIKGGRKFRS